MTLIFSLERYRAVMNAYLEGLEKAHAAGKDLSQDPLRRVVLRLPRRHRDRQAARRDRHRRGPALKGKAGVANARLAYQAFEEVFSTPRWGSLADEGANPQRPLWASTGVKDPAYPDTLYVTELVAADVVNTMPDKTLEATADHGDIHGDTVTGGYEQASNVLDDLERVGVSYHEVVELLEDEGVDKFEKAWGELLDGVDRRDVEGVRMSSLSVSASGAAADAIATHVPVLVADGVASKLFAQDATLWGPEAEAESRIRLSWVGPAPLLAAARRRDRGAARRLREPRAHHVVLCGMGGSSLAPEVICATAGKDLVVLDSSDPDYVRRALGDDLEHTVVVVSSKSGSTVETDSQRRAYEGAFSDAGIDPATRIVIVTDPGSPLDQESRAKGYRVVNADPDVGGRYSALTAFGLVPSGLAGVDVGALLDEAESVADLLAEDDEANPALRLGAAMGGTAPLRDKLVLVDEGSGIVGFADWAEQLIAESTGKDGTGVLPVVVEGADAPEVRSAAADVLVARLVPGRRRHRALRRTTCASSGALGAQLLLWEAATAVAGRLLGINPFDQPDVESAKKAARALLDQGTAASEAPPPPTAPSRSAPWAATGWAPPRPSPRRSTRCSASSTRSAATSRSWPTSTGSATPTSPRSRPGRRAHRPPDDLRLGAPLPALDGPVPQGRPGCRRLRADHDGARRGPLDPRSRVHLRRLHRLPGRRRRPGARRPRPARCCACTSPTTTPASPRSRPRSRGEGVDESGANRPRGEPASHRAGQAPPPHRRTVRSRPLRCDR